MCKVISLYDFRNRKMAEHMTVKCEPKQDEENLSFEKIEENNKRNANRVKRERNRANKDLVKDLRLK